MRTHRSTPLVSRVLYIRFILEREAPHTFHVPILNVELGFDLYGGVLKRLEARDCPGDFECFRFVWLGATLWAGVRGFGFGADEEPPFREAAVGGRHSMSIHRIQSRQEELRKKERVHLPVGFGPRWPCQAVSRRSNSSRGRSASIKHGVGGFEGERAVEA